MRRLPRVDRLTVRLALGTTLLVVGLLSIGFYALSRRHFDEKIEAQRKAAELENRVLETTLRHQMAAKDDTLLNEILSEIGSETEVESASILDHKGTVKLSSRPELVGTKLSQDSPTCLVCHERDPEDREHSVLLEDGEGGVLRNVLPIENRPQCHECHDSANRMNGILILDVSLEGVQEEIRRDTAWMMGGTAALAFLLLVGTSFFIRRLVLVRLWKLGRTTRAIAAGELAKRAVEEGNDVITSLARDVNSLAASVSRLVGEVREQEGQLVSVMSSLDDGLVVLDRNFRIVASNRAFCARLNAYPETLRGRNCHEAVGAVLPCERSPLDCPAEKCLATGRVQRATVVFPASNGRPRRVEEVSASPVFDDDREVKQVVEVWRNITERVEEEERLAEIERMVSLGVLASGFSHEVNTPLASMLTCAESVLRRIDEPAPQSGAETRLPAIRESAEIIRREVFRCRKITEQFLRFSRGIPPSIEPIDLRETVASVISLVAPTAREARVVLRLEGETPLPAVAANTEVVQHVVLNLLVNAIQSYDGPGGSVVVRFEAGSDVRIQIEDNGSGIAEEARSHLFEPFRTRKPRGTGLGLFLSRTFMRRFGGDVRLAWSQVGAGSRFEVVFPRANDRTG
ncbi:MAG: PAS domain-containing protein [Planctomycetes bacterium]|nr:PAS domain-containing protein [Planctomycetota bacterium]